MDLKKTSRDLHKRKSYEGIAVFIALFSLVAAIVGVVLQFRWEKKRELTGNVISSNELTSISAVPELSSRFTYKGKEVAHLWKLVLNFVNTGNETLIGTGPHNNLMGEDPALSFEFPQGTEILNFEIVNSDVVDLIVEQPKLQVREAGNGQGQTNLQSDEPKELNKFRLKFSQWRPNERLTLSMYIASPSSKAIPLLPKVNSRDIVDGDVIVKNSLTQVDQQKTSLIDRLPLAISITVKFFISSVCGVLAWFGLLVVPIGAARLVRKARWKRQHFDEYKIYVNALPDLEDYQKELYLGSPEAAPWETWEDYPGERLNIRGSLWFDDFSDLLTFGVPGLLLGVAGSIYVLSNASDLYRAVLARFF